MEQQNAFVHDVGWVLGVQVFRVEIKLKTNTTSSAFRYETPNLMIH